MTEDIAPPIQPVQDAGYSAYVAETLNTTGGRTIGGRGRIRKGAKFVAGKFKNRSMGYFLNKTRDDYVTQKLRRKIDNSAEGYSARAQGLDVRNDNLSTRVLEKAIASGTVGAGRTNISARAGAQAPAGAQTPAQAGAQAGMQAPAGAQQSNTEIKAPIKRQTVGEARAKQEAENAARMEGLMRSKTAIANWNNPYSKEANKKPEMAEEQNYGGLYNTIKKLHYENALNIQPPINKALSNQNKDANNQEAFLTSPIANGSKQTSIMSNKNKKQIKTIA